MHEKDIRAVAAILFEIKNNPVLLPGFERLCYKWGYWGIEDLYKAFQKLCDTMDEWGNPVEHIYIMEDIKIQYCPEVTSQESQQIHVTDIAIEMEKK